MRRLVALLTCAALALAACGSDGGGSSLDDARAATIEEGTATMRLEISTGGQALTGEGVVDFANATAQLDLDLGEAFGAPGAPGENKLIVADGLLYLKIPALAGFLGAGDKWLSLKPTDLSAGLGLEDSIASSLGDPAAQLSLLDTLDLDAAEEVGEEEIDGTSTTHYKVASETGDVEVWLDDESRVRRVRTALPAPEGEGDAEAGETTITVEYSDFGTEAVVEPPAEGDTIDAGPLLGALTGG